MMTSSAEVSHCLVYLQDVANAIGAALGTVGATVDSIESLVVGEGREGERESERVKRARLDILRRARERAISDAIKKGAVASEVYIHSEDLVDVTYVQDKLHVRVKAIGPLRDSASERMSFSVQDNPHWPFVSADDREKDSAANLPTPQVEGVFPFSLYSQPLVSLYTRIHIHKYTHVYTCTYSFNVIYTYLVCTLSLSLSGGVWSLGRHDVECVAVGAGLLGCGGGGDPNTGRLLALQQLDNGNKITVVNPLR